MNGVTSANYRADQAFFTRIAFVVAGIAILGFVRFALSGTPEYRGAPLYAHVYAFTYLTWLMLFMAQNVLAGRGSITQHRKLGLIGALLLLVLIVTGSYAGIQAIVLERTPPHYTPAHFLPLVQFCVLGFGGLAIASLILKRDTQSHRRLMLCAVIVMADPGLDRLVPGPPIGGLTAQWIIMALQLVLIGIVMVHDRKV
ncbi:MAG: hypothetical protein KUG65_00240, partial [Sphingomonadaceae bacterium]|nr:hypothetical protein [Sphingomonadaceae bacterium]